MRTLFTLLALALTALPAFAQSAPPDFLAIQDNSFLIEEAYNQEDGVVQHIQNVTRDQRSGAWLYTFTQEWPVTGIRHQFSYTLPVARVAAAGLQSSGVGDVLLNYRYQLAGDGKSRVAIAPRFSLILPTGNVRRGLGGGAFGYQLNLPASIVLGSRAVTHINAGATWVPSAENSARDRASVRSFNLGDSVIVALRPNIHFMLEGLWCRGESVVGVGSTAWSTTAYISPGVRYAYNASRGLQIVPGIAVPIGVGPSAGERSIFLYLSLEHPFR